MAVLVQVIGMENGVDIPLKGHDAVIERLQTKEEIVIVKDIDGLPLALVPLHNVRFILPIEETNDIPKSFGPQATLNVHIIGNNAGDFNVPCNRIEYTRKFDTLNAELFTVIRQEGGETLNSLQAVLPFKNIRYVDFNFVQEVEETNNGTEQVEAAEQVATPAPPKRSGGNFKIKGQKNK